MRIAILGGSFDPVHAGHLAMAHAALDVLKADRVWFLPTKKTPLKDRSLSAAQDRLAMLELALSKEPAFEICTLELERDGISYTIDTLEELTARYPEHRFMWLIGNDQAEQFAAWKEPDRLVSLAEFVCIDRDGKNVRTPYPMRHIHMPPVPVSSTQIRQGNGLNYVDKAVLAYIYEKGLYVEQFVQSRLKPKRYRHSLSVAALCEEFAQAHALDARKAYMIGLFHDICKNMSEKEMRPWMESLFPDQLHWPVPVWHGFVGSAVIRRIFSIDDDQIANAVYHHVLGTSRDPYAMIIFCADKLDPLRGYPVQEQIDRVKEDLSAGFDAVKKENQAYLEGKETHLGSENSTCR